MNRNGGLARHFFCPAVAEWRHRAVVSGTRLACRPAQEDAQKTGGGRRPAKIYLQVMQTTT